MKITSINTRLNFGMFRKDAAEHLLNTSSNVKKAKSTICNAASNKDYHIGITDDKKYFIYKGNIEDGLEDCSDRTCVTNSAQDAVNWARTCTKFQYAKVANNWNEGLDDSYNPIDLLTDPVCD